MTLKYACEDFLEFQDSLKKMREVDDKIIYALNTIPTISFRGQVDSTNTCSDLHSKLHKTHEERQSAIKFCIQSSANKVKELKVDRENNRDDIIIDKQFKSEQRKLRLLQSELNVEDIVRERTFKVFNERCRLYFKSL